MASGSAGRANAPGSKGFDFASDDILCSYEDYGNHDGSNGSTHSEPGIGTGSAKEFHKSRMARPSMFPATSYSPPEESSFNQDVISTVEKTMKKYADNLMRFLEGISSRLSQLELYCYNLDKTIGEMRSELVRDHGDAESRLKSVEKHLQEVHRSVQILRDKQELADTQKELAKLQLAHKETSSGSNSQQNQDRATAAAVDAQKSDTASEMHGQQLALALPHQVLPQPPVPARPVEQPQQPPVAPAPPMQSQSMAQQPAYYLPHSQISTAPSPVQPSQGQYLTSDSQYRTPQMQDLSRVTAQPQVNQSPQVQQLPPQYQPQWQQQLHQQVQQPPQPQPQPQPQPPAPLQPQMRPSSASVYASYMPSQPNPSLPEVVPNNSMPMQVQFSGISPPTASRPEPTGFGYVGAGRPVQPQHLKATYTTPGDGYVGGGPHPTISSGNAYVMYDEGVRGHHPPQAATHFPQGAYPPSSMPPQNLQPPSGSSMVIRPPPQFVRNPPYNELIEKLVSMGYRGEHVVSVIQRLEESGQPVDFNTVLDRLNGHASGGSQRGWSG